MNLKLLAFLLIILSFRFSFFYNNQPQFTDGQQVSFETALLSEPRIVGGQQRLTANLASGNKVFVTTSLFPSFHYGNRLYIVGKLNKRLLNRNFILVMYFPKIEEVNNQAGWLDKSLKTINDLRQSLISLFSRTLPSPSSSLLMGIIFGIKQDLPKDFSDNLKTTGVFHVIAASGMNVTLIAGFISTFFAFFLKRQIAIGLSILGIIFYAVLAGLEASIIRASIMGILVFSAQIMGRQTLAVNGLFLAGFAMLFLDPTLISDIGFQLSFTATLGLILIPKIRAIGKIGVIGNSVNTTIAAQIATLPILMANFGIYSIYSVLVNGLVLWTVPILMVIGGIGAIAGLIFAPVGQLIIYLCYPLLIYFEKIVEIFGKIGGVINVQSIQWQFIAAYYCLLISALIIFKKK